MALLFADSFDSYSAVADFITSGRYLYDQWCTLNGSGSGVFGGQCYSTVGASQTYTSGLQTKNIGLSAGNTLYMGFWTKNSGYPTSPPVTNNGLCLATSAGAGQSILTMAGTGGAPGALCAMKLGSSTVLATGTTNVADNRWHWVELGVSFSTSASGWFKLYVDGILQFNYSGVTLNAAMTFLGNVWLAGLGNNNNPTTFYDDVIVYDNTGTNADFNGTNFPLGPRRMCLLLPNADGDLTQFTPLSGTPHYPMVNGGYGSTNYVYDTNTGIGNIELYKFQALPYVPAKVNAVIGNLWGQNAGAGTVNITPQLKVNSVTLASAAQQLPQGSDTLFTNTYLTDSQGNPWTGASVNASQFGLSD